MGHPATKRRRKAVPLPHPDYLPTTPRELATVRLQDAARFRVWYQQRGKELSALCSRICLRDVRALRDASVAVLP
jgi:hypothetical protein